MWQVDAAVAEVLGENLCVVVNHPAGSLTEAYAPRDLRLEVLLAYVRRNCSDSDLSPATAVTHMRVSVRSVHKLTERTEHTFGEWLLDERLHRYVRMFRDPAQVRRKISDIAWTCGLNDLSHFNNVFSELL